MPPLTDAAQIRARLEHDRPWSAFALADLEPLHAPFTSWFGAIDGTSVVLVYGAYDPPIVMCHGTATECDALLGEPAVVALTRCAYLNVTAELLPAIGRHFARFERRAMIRMIVDDAEATTVGAAGVVRLGPDDLPRVQALYAEEPPAFFRPEQLRDGVYFGVPDGDGLAAVAGTHVLSTALGVAALGNVHTRRTCRRRGLGTAAVVAVVAELQRLGIRTIVLNIVATNGPARRIYERIGFREYCAYSEGTAWR